MLLKTKISLLYVLRQVKLEIVYTIVIWIVTYVLHHSFESILPVMPISIPAFLGTAISVLLSFKLNQSYNRWWEARKIWGSIVNDSRTFVLQLQSFVSPARRDDIRTIAFRQIAWCFSLGQSLRGLDATKNLDKYLCEDELSVISKHSNKPLAILQLNADHIAGLKNNEALDIFGQVQINHTLVNFSNSMGMAERIKTTIFPVTYRNYLHWIIYLFTITLSVALDDVKWYFELPLVLAISFSFFLLERAGTQLQDPFSNKPTDTAMTTLATTIEINLKQLLNEPIIPQAFPPEKFYAL